MGLILEDIINQHGLYIKTNTGFTYQQYTMVSNSGKSSVDLTLTRGLKNIKLVTKDFTLIKTRHKAIEILIDQEPWFNPNPKFRAKNADWEKWKQFLQAPLEDYSLNFPLKTLEKIIDQQVKKLTDLIVGSANNVSGSHRNIKQKKVKVGGITTLKLPEKR